MEVLADCRMGDLERPPRAEEIRRAETETFSEEARSLHLIPLKRVIRKEGNLPDFLLRADPLLLADTPIQGRLGIPSPLANEVEFPPHFEYLGEARHYSNLPFKLWHVPAPAISAARKVAEARAAQLAGSATAAVNEVFDRMATSPLAKANWNWQTLNLHEEKRSRIISEIPQSIVQETSFDRWARGGSIERSRARALEFAFWCAVHRSLIAKLPPDVDLVVRVPTNINQQASLGFFRMAEIEAIRLDHTGRLLHRAFERFIDQAARNMKEGIERELECPAHRALIVSAYRKLPRIEANDAESWAIVDYLLQRTGQSKEQDAEPDSYGANLSALPPEALPKMKRAIEEAISGKLDRLAFRRARGVGDTTHKFARELLVDEFKSRRKSLLSLVERPMKDEKLVLVWARCATDHLGETKARAPRAHVG